MMYELETGRLDLESRELIRDGQVVPLQRRALDVLGYLLCHRERAVSREELLEHCWRGVAVTDGSLSTCIRKLRQALGDDARSPRMITTVHAHGYRFTGEVRERERHPGAGGGIPVAPMTAEPPPHDLIGREVEVDCAMRLWAGARSGRGGLLRIEGDPGMGKTYLAAAVASHVNREGGLTVHASAADIEDAPPLWLWMNVVRRLSERLGDAALSRTLGPHAAAIAYLLPELAERLDLDTGGEIAPTERPWVLDALTQLALRLSRSGPVCLVLDDLQWADAESLRVLQLLLPSLGDAPLMVLALHRPAARRSPLSRALGNWRRAGFSEKCVLGPLAHEAARRLVERTTTLQLESAAIDAVTRRAQGNPLYLVELSRLVACDPDAAHDLPESLVQVVEARLAMLSTPALGVLHAAAASGAGVALDRRGLMEVAGCSEPELQSALEEAAAHQLLRPAPGRDPRIYTFTHALVRDCVYELTPHDQRWELHRRTYEHIERSFARWPHAAGLLRHHAEAMSDPVRLARMTHRVVQLTYDLGARHAASEMARRALEVQGERMDPTERARLLLEQARALAATGAPIEDVVAVHAEMRALGVNPTAPELVAECALEATGYGLFSGTTRRVGLAMPVEIEFVEQALEQLASRAAWSPLVESWLACLLHRSARCHQAKETSERALARAREIDQPVVICATLLGHASVCAGGEEPSHRSAFALRALDLAKRLNRPALQMEALAQHVAARLSAGDTVECQLDRMDQVVRDSGMDLLELPSLFVRIGQALAAVEFDRARLLAKRAFELTQPSSPASAVVAPMTVELVIAHMSGKAAPWMPQPEPGPDGARDLVPLRGVELSNYVSMEDHEATRRCLDDIMIDLPSWEAHLDWLVLLGTCARAAAMLRHRTHAHTVAQLLARHEDRFVVLADGLVLMGPAALELAVLKDVLGESDEADRLFGKAEHACIRMKARAPLLLTRVKAAESRWRRGHRSALAQLGDLRDTAEGLGYLSLVRDIECSTQATLRARPGRGGIRLLPSPPSTR